MEKLSKETIEFEIKLGILQAKELLRYQLGEIDKDTFVQNLYVLQNSSEKFPVNEGWVEWIEMNLENQLPNSSSGSFFTALTDIDGLLSALGMEEDIYTQEEYYDMVNYHQEMFVYRINPILRKLANQATC